MVETWSFVSCCFCCCVHDDVLLVVVWWCGCDEKTHGCLLWTCHLRKSRNGLFQEKGERDAKEHADKSSKNVQWRVLQKQNKSENILLPPVLSFFLGGKSIFFRLRSSPFPLYRIRRSFVTTPPFFMRRKAEKQELMKHKRNEERVCCDSL